MPLGRQVGKSRRPYLPLISGSTYYSLITAPAGEAWIPSCRHWPRGPLATRPVIHTVPECNKPWERRPSRWWETEVQWLQNESSFQPHCIPRSGHRTHFPPLPDETQHQLCLAAFASPGCHWLHGLEVASLSLCLQPGLGLGAHVCFRDKNNDIEWFTGQK